MAGLRLFTTFQNKRIIYASSSTAVEPDKNPYALSKKTLEKLAPFNSVGLRFTTVYGPNARESMLIPMICNGAVKYINTNHSRDFIHVQDVCDAIKVVMQKPIKGVIDIGTGKSHKLLDIMGRFNINGFDKKIGGDTERLDNKADISVLRQFEWKPKIDLEDYLMKKLYPLAEMTIGDQR
jgi:nucleoside-diphosphate-sugar epimerase